MLKNKTILITGGTGSFGNAFLNKILDSDFKEIRIFSRDEKKQNDMRLKYNNNKLKFYIGDVRSFDSINSAMKSVDYVFCAAALKQVPSCEFYPIEAVKTNIIGIENTLQAAIQNKVEKVVVLSTDKAVYPINAMGMSKGLMEKVALAKAREIGNSGTKICITRYGNVMASRGSVIPLFVEQIKNNKSLTVTDPNMTRFVMSLSDAVNLVVYAFNNSSQGDIFVQQSPAATINTLVEALKEIFNANNKIKILGTRHGEKKYEVLLNREEMIKAESIDGYFRVSPDNRNLNYENYFEKGDRPLSTKNEYNSDNTKQLNRSEMVDLLMKLDFINHHLNN